MNLFIINAMDRKTLMIETYKAVILFVASDLLRRTLGGLSGDQAVLSCNGSRVFALFA